MVYRQSYKKPEIKSAECQKCGSDKMLYKFGNIICLNCDNIVKEVREIKLPKGKVTTKKCKECGIDFVSVSNKMRSFCSHKCSNIYGNRKRSNQAKKKMVCLTCKKVFYKRQSDVKIYAGSMAKNKYRYCSQKCWKARVQTISSLKKKTWIVFSNYIRERDDWLCYTCGKYEVGRNMHAGHYISRRHNSTLFDEDNVHAQCSKCNMFNNGEPHLYTERLIAEKGQDFLLDLIKRSKETKKFTKQELLNLIELYKQKTEDIKKSKNGVAKHKQV